MVKTIIIGFKEMKRKWVFKKEEKKRERREKGLSTFLELKREKEVSLEL